MKNQGFFWIILSQLMVSISIVSNKVLLAHLPLTFVLGFRFSCATLLGLPILLHHMQAIRSLGISNSFKLFIQAMLGGFLFNILMYGGLIHTSANYAALMTSLLPFIVIILSFWLLKEKIHMHEGVAIIIASMGAFFIHLSPHHGLGSVYDFQGTLLIFFALVVDALYLIFSKKYQLPLSGLVTTLLMVMLNAICFLPLMNQCDIQFSHLSHLDWTLLVLMTFSLMGFYIFWLKSAQFANASTIAISTALSPIITVILSWYFLDEKLQLLGVLGMALIILALFLQKRWVPKFSIHLLSRNINRR